jgi:hypothetical protein
MKYSAIGFSHKQIGAKQLRVTKVGARQICRHSSNVGPGHHGVLAVAQICLPQILRVDFSRSTIKGGELITVD